MSNKRDHRRGGASNVKRTENGPRYEKANPGKGCNSTHVAGSRRKWADRRRRHERRASKLALKAAS